MGHFPAIDIEASVSRAMTEITSEAHQQTVRRFRQLYSTYQHNRDLISVGAYQRGSDPRVDEAIEYEPRLMEFLRQGIRESRSFQASVDALFALLGGKAG
jgi:flagellum-specific ATP synthase